MNDIFLVFGYGIPKNILKDENYNFYLKIVFNRIYDITSKSKSKKTLIICSGGKTDMFKPYKRTEADEMIRLLKKNKQKTIFKKDNPKLAFYSREEIVVYFGEFIELPANN